MISKIKGIVEDIEAGRLILFVSGLGFSIYVTEKLSSDVQIGQEICLYIESYIYDGNVKFYGLVSKDEMSYFKLLINVNGIGHKIALIMIDKLGIDGINRALSSKDENLIKVPGVGAKLAKRIISELSDTKFDFCSTTTGSINTNDSVSILVNLGYSRSLAVDAIRKVYKEDLDTKELVKLGLKLLKNV